MEQLNRVELRGTVGSIRKTNVSEKTLASITVATNYAYRAEDGTAVIETTWHLVKAWEGKNITKEILDSLGRGNTVYVVGRIRNIRMTGEDGIDRTTSEILASRLVKITSDEPLTYEM